MRHRLTIHGGLLRALLAALLASSLLASFVVAQSAAAGPAGAPGGGAQISTTSTTGGVTSAPVSAPAPAQYKPTESASSPAAAPAPPFTPSGLVTSFVQRAGTRFVVAARGTNGTSASGDSCEAFNFVGWNTFYLMLRAADPGSRCEVLEVLDKAQQLGLTVLRTWAFSDGAQQWRALQRAPGVYDENTFAGLDFVIHQASLRGIRVLLAFGNYWQHYGGVDQYNVWSFEAGRGRCNGHFACRDTFFSDTYARQLYKAHIRTLLTRVNTFSGVAYRDDPAIFGFDLMNEPRSTADLYVQQRRASSGPVYNITFNSGDALHSWISDMAAYVKRIDPVHLLTVGSEGFFGPSSPLFLYANPGPWAALEGVDFVRNHRVAGIDFAATHVYVDQWLCTERGATRDGQLGFFRDWIDAHMQAAEEELQMPMIVEEFGAKLPARADIYKAAFEAFAASARRGGGGGGVMFWDIYHSAYAPLDEFGGGYGNFVPATSNEAAVALDLIRNHAATVAAINAASAGAATCVWAPPRAAGAGCAGLTPQLELGAMPWACLPGEAENVNSCAPAGNAANLFRNPPPQWRGASSGKSLPFNGVEALVMGKLVNNGSASINLRGTWLIVPFSRGVHTKYEGEWQRVSDPNTEFTRYCWFASEYKGDGGFTYPYIGDLCANGGMSLSFTDTNWPAGTKRDRGLNISFTRDLWLGPGQSIHAGSQGAAVMISFKAGLNRDTSRRLDVSSLELAGALHCPLDPGPAYSPPPPPGACPHPNRACPQPLSWAAGLREADPAALPEPKAVLSVSSPMAVGAMLQPGAQFHVSARVRLQGLSEAALAAHMRNGTAALAAASSADATTSAPNPGERFTARVAQGVAVQLVLRWRASGQAGLRYSVVAHAEAPAAGNWTRLAGVVELEADPTPADADSTDADPLPELQLFAEAFIAGVRVEVADVAVREAWTLPEGDAALYIPCQLDPTAAPDGVIVIPAGGESYTADIKLCSLGYDQSLRLYDDTGKVIAVTDATCGRTDALRGLRIDAWRRYTLVIDGQPGETYGSRRGGFGVHITRPDGAPSVGGYDARPPPEDAARFVRAVNGTFYLGCDAFAYVGCNTWDLMDTARYPNLRPLVDKRLDDMRSRGLTVGRTWAFSLGTGESMVQRQQALQVRPGVYDEGVFKGLDYALVAARQRGIKLILCLEDYWLSVDRYIAWSPTAGGKTDFYTDFAVRQMYKAHLRYFTSRVNSISGVAYRDDPTIFAWNLLNEPRCTGCGWAMTEWVTEMAQYMKAIDPHHMVTVGEEGFYSSTCERVYLNPGAGKRRTGIASSPWALMEGQDFNANHAGPHIDFSTLHAWPDNWLGFADHSPVNSNQAFDYTFGSEVWREKLDYLRRWVQAHIEDATAMRKPLVIEEFGKAIPAPVVYDSGFLGPGEWMQGDLTLRNKFFQQVYQQVEASALNGGAIGGSNFWVLYRADGQGNKDPYRITVDDVSTFQIVNDHRWNMRAVRWNRPKMCPAGLDKSQPLYLVGDDGFLDKTAFNFSAPPPRPMTPRPEGGAGVAFAAAAGEAASAQRAAERKSTYAQRVKPAAAPAPEAAEQAQEQQEQKQRASWWPRQGAAAAPPVSMQDIVESDNSDAATTAPAAAVSFASAGKARAEESASKVQNTVAETPKPAVSVTKESAAAAPKPAASAGKVGETPKRSLLAAVSPPPPAGAPWWTLKGYVAPPPQPDEAPEARVSVAVSPAAL
jgi:mannan endo-1,4-beta-mannosidase